MKKPILRSTLIAALIAAAGHANAAGLGRITVLSSLGQPLRAEVEVAASPEELETLSARLASPDSFKRANIEYAGSLTGIRMAVERRGASAIVRVTSDRPFNEPFVDMLIELNWAGGRLLREYTFLLDPSENAVRPLAGEPGPAVAAPVAPAPSVSAPRSTTTAPAAAPARRAAATPAPAASTESRKIATDGEYEVQKGDSLSSIATDLRGDGVTQDQMLAALYQANTQAFTNGNINRLRAGRILSVPTAEDAKAIAPREARQIVLKASNFDAYRNQVAAAAEVGPAREASGSQSSSGQIAPRVQETAPAQASTQDKLKIAKTQVAAAGAAGAADGKAAAGRIQALEEDIASRDKALKEARSRVAELEKNIKGLQDLVKMKDENLANLQKQSAAAEKAAQEAQKKADALAKSADSQKAAEARKAADDAKKAAEDAKKAADDAKKAETARLAEEQKAEEARKAAEAQRLADEQKAAEEAKAAAELAAAQSAAAAVAAPAASEPVVETPPVEEVASAPAPAPQVAAQQPAPPPAPQPVVEEESSFPGGTLGMLLAAAALLGGGLLWRKKQQQNKNSSLNTTALTEASTSPNSVFGNAGGQTVDTGTSVLHTDFSQSGLSAIDTDEGVDPVAEADVYMAYGRDAQAEEILLDALKNDPSRTAIYVKLLEIYSQRRSVKQFENIATDLFTQTGGAGDDWAKAAALGVALDPENGLYRNGAPVAAAPVAAPSVPTPVAAAAAAAAVAPLTIPDPLEEEATPAVTFGTNNVSQMRATWTVPGEINQFTNDADGVPQISPEPVATAQSPEPLNLDFNLDLELPNEDEPETRMEARDADEDILRPLDEQTVEVAADESAPLEFDIGDLGSKSLSSDAAMSRTLPEGIGALNAESLPTSLTDADLGIERNLEDDGLAVVDLEKTNFEGNLLDFDFELGDEAKRGTAMPDRSVDLSNIGLRTDGNMQSTGGIAVPPSVTVATSEDVPDSIDLNEEVSTKLELARAYEEMGDLEGARELLEEVVSDGASQQKDQARQILARLG